MRIFFDTYNTVLLANLTRPRIEPNRTEFLRTKSNPNRTKSEPEPN